MTSATDASHRVVDRVTARGVLVFAALFLLAGVGGVFRGVSEDRFPGLALFVVVCAVTSVVRARRHLARE